MEHDPIQDEGSERVDTPEPVVNGTEVMYANLKTISGEIGGGTVEIRSGTGDASSIQIHFTPLSPIYKVREEVAEALVDGGGNLFTVYLDPSRVSGSVKAAQGTFQVGMIGTLKLMVGESVHPKVAVEILGIDEAGKVALRTISPTNVLPFSAWGDSESEDVPAQLRPQDTTRIPPWSIISTVLGFDLEANIELDGHVSIVKLTLADQIELEKYRHDWFGNSYFSFPSWNDAICIKDFENNTGLVPILLRGLQLFKHGHLEIGMRFFFRTQERNEKVTTDLGIAWSPDRSYRDEFPKYSISEAEVPSLRSWLYLYNRIANETESDSILARVLDRFGATFNQEDPHERVTDAVIGIERLVMPGKNTGEIGYRVALRASFLASDDPKTRLELFKKVNDGYDIRSAAVHSGGKKQGVTHALADEYQDLLRACIKRILDGDQILVMEFCKGGDTNEINRFYNAFISFGNFQEALHYWADTKPKPSKKQRK